MKEEKITVIKDKCESEKGIAVAPFRKGSIKTSPHRHNNYFEVVYLSSGQGTHVIDSVAYPVTPPVAFFIRKDQVHYWEFSEPPEGFVMMLRKCFFEENPDSELRQLIAKLSGYTCLRLSGALPINALFALLTEECSIENSKNGSVINGLLKALLGKMLVCAELISLKTAPDPSLYTQFQEMLARPEELRNSVAWYAGRLNTTPQNLNAACRKASGQTASDVLADFMIGEAKRLLLYTDNTVSQIALALRFNDTSHFVKYFKRYTTLTPTAFRKQG